jgi:hypothetical protein
VLDRLADLIPHPVHALAIRAYTPDEFFTPPKGRIDDRTTLALAVMAALALPAAAQAQAPAAPKARRRPPRPPEGKALYPRRSST